MFLFNAYFIYIEWIAAIYSETWKYNCKSMAIIQLNPGYYLISATTYTKSARA